MMMKPEGIYSAMMTPFDAQGRVDTEQAKAITRFLIEKKVDGAFCVSNVGEFLHMDMDEKKALIDAVLEAGEGKLRVTPGVCDVKLKDSIALANYSARAGADAVVICAPYYYPYPQEYIRTYLKEVVENAPLPVILYNAPGFTSAIQMDNLLSLCAHPNVVGVKESSGDIRFTYQLMRALEEQKVDINVMVGFEELLLPGLTAGVKGCTVSCGGIIPEVLHEILNAYRAGDMVRASAAQKAVVAVTDELKKIGFPYGYKLGCLARGFDFKLFKEPCMAALEQKLVAELPRVRAVIWQQMENLGLKM